MNKNKGMNYSYSVITGLEIIFFVNSLLEFQIIYFAFAYKHRWNTNFLLNEKSSLLDFM